MIASEVVVALFFSSQILRGTVVAVSLFIIIYIGTLMNITKGRIRLKKIHWLFWFFIGLGFYGLIVGYFRELNLYYLAADVYHWFFELLLVAIITYNLVCKLNDEILIKIVLYVGLLMGCLGIIFEIMALAQVVNTGGNFVASLGFWRMHAGRGFPEILLILVAATYCANIKLTRTLSCIRTIAMITLFLDLIFVLKRVMWLSSVLAFAILFSRRKLLKYIIFCCISCIVIFTSTITSKGRELILFISDKLWFLNFNVNYSIEETLSERLMQMVSLRTYLQDNLFGHGFGAEYYTYATDINSYDYVHYLHNLYIYYILQFGYVLSTLFFLSLLYIVFRNYKWILQRSEYSWRYSAALACLLAIMFNGITLVSTHTIFFGVVIGVATFGFNRELNSV
jgi:hypothetical protein